MNKNKTEEKIEASEEKITEEGEKISGEAAEMAEEEAEKAEEAEEVEEAKPRLKEAVEEEVVEERFYTIPLGRARLMPPNKRAAKAVRILRDFIKRHMKIEAVEEGEEPKKLIISNEVNEEIWRRGIEKPPRKIRVRAAKDKEGNVTVYLAAGD
jgi:large subunit ribosomal protein L31e